MLRENKAQYSSYFMHFNCIDYHCNMASPSPPYSPCDISKFEAKVRVPARKLVRNVLAFKATVIMHNVLHLDDYSDEEVAACWFDNDGVHRFKTDLKLTMKLIEIGDLSYDTEEHCRRGTEYRTPNGAQKRKRNKAVALDAVLDEQEAQWDADRIDPEGIAIVYMAATRHCKFEAHMLALTDEKVARELDMKSSSPSQAIDKLETGTTAPLDIPSKSVQFRRLSLYNAAA